jgi:hypothetical protein
VLGTTGVRAEEKIPTPKPAQPAEPPSEFAIVVLGTAGVPAEEKIPAPKPTQPAEPPSEFATVSAGELFITDKLTPCLMNWVHRRAACCQHLWDWLCYKPTRYGYECACHKQCNPCGTPRMYIFFLCDGNGHCNGNGPCPGNGQLYGR